MKSKIYIAGAITGDPNYKEKFAKAAEEWQKRGYVVLLPSVMPLGMQPADYMRICFAMIDSADAVAFLPDYEQNPGAQLELQYCFYIDKTVHLPECKHEVLVKDKKKRLCVRQMRRALYGGTPHRCRKLQV